VLAAIAEGNTRRGAIAGHIGRKLNELSHPLTVLEDSGLIVREGDAFRANRTDFRIDEPLLAFCHSIMRPLWSQLLRGSGAERAWESSRHRFASTILGPHFERVCREWSLYFAGDRFGDWPVQVTAGTVNDPASKTTSQVDVAVVGNGGGARPPLLAIGEAKWNDVVGPGHLDRLHRLRELLRASDRYDTTQTRLICFSGAGFTDDLKTHAGRSDVMLVGLNDLYRPAQ
jgi:uncharacterized protein